MESVVTAIFSFLCGILYVIGLALGFNYQEISVYICINFCCYAAIILSFITFIMNVIATFRKYNLIWLTPLTFIHFFLCLNIGTQCLLHYSTYSTISGKFNACRNDLMNIASTLHTTYEHVNLIIYCVIFFGFIGYNLLLDYFFYKKLKTKKVKTL